MRSKRKWCDICNAQFHLIGINITECLIFQKKLILVKNVIELSVFLLQLTDISIDSRIHHNLTHGIFHDFMIKGVLDA